MLAAGYIRESGARAAVSVGALVTAVALFTALVIMIHSFRESVTFWLDHTLRGDLFLRTRLSVVNLYKDPLPPEITEALKNMEGPYDLVPNRTFLVQHGGFPLQFVGMNFKTFFRHCRFLYIDKIDDAEKLLLSGKGVAVSEVFTAKTGLGVGDALKTQILGTVITKPIVAVFRDYRTRGGIAYYSLPHLQDDLNDPSWSEVRFFFRNAEGKSHDPTDGELSALERAVINLAGDRVDIIRGKILKAAILKVFDETFAITGVLLLIAITVAALGITTTLTILIWERSAQFSTLLAVGADKAQIRGIIFWEAVVIVIMGEWGGLLCGFILSWLLVYVINHQSFGWTFIYKVDWYALALSFPLIIITALGASLPAVRTVFRIPPATLLRQNR